jgi:putative cell wall-binding protein
MTGVAIKVICLKPNLSHMKKTALLVAFVTLIGFTSAAQHNSGDIETAIVASTSNYPDALMGSAASDKIGAPVLLTQKDTLSASTESTLSEMSVDEVVILGGPAVISESVEAEIDAEVNTTTRLWGVSQVGTSVQTSEYFWTESDEAAIVQYPQDAENGYKLLSAVKNEVHNEDEPILISKAGTISASVLSEINRLGATEVEVYSTEAVNVSQDLEEIGVQEVTVNEGDIEEVTEEVENRTDSTNASNLVVVAAANFRQAISVPTSANGASVMIGSKAEIGQAVRAVNKASIKEVKVVGKPDLAEQIAERLRNETDKEVDVNSGEPEETAAETARSQAANWSKIQEKRLGNWKEKARNSQGLETAANKTLKKAEATVNENSSQRSQELLQEAKKAFKDGDFFEAKKKATSATSQAKMNRFKDLSNEEVRQEYWDEREDVKEAARKLQEANKEISEELKNVSQKERLEIISEYKEKRKSIREDIRDEKRDMGPPLKPDDSRETKPEDENDDEDLNAGESEMEIEGEASTISADMSYMAKSGGFTVESESNTGKSNVTFSFDLESPDGLATMAITGVKASESVENLNPGNYTVKATVSVDGEEVSSIFEEVTLEE